MIRKMPGVSLRSGRARTRSLACRWARPGPIGTKRFLAGTFWEAMLPCVVAALSVCSPYRYLGERGFALLSSGAFRSGGPNFVA
jgi:hypothetical protein